MVFTSKNGVDFFFESLFEKGLDVRAIGAIKIGVVGPQTNEALLKYGLKADLLPTTYNGDSLGALLGYTVNKNEQVLIMRATLHGEALTEHLKQNGIRYEDVAIYETKYLSQENNLNLLKYLKNEKTLIAFTSGSTVDGFMKNIDGLEVDIGSF